MRKSIFIVVGIGLIILLLFILGTRFLESRKSELNSAAQEARMKADDAAIKSKILELSLVLEDWYDQNGKSYANFTGYQPNNDNVQNSIDTLGREKSIQLNYFIASTKEHYVVRVESLDQRKLYCIDSSSPNVSESTSLAEEVFRSKTNCNGKSL